jgi:general secretion pathway protein L
VSRPRFYLYWQDHGPLLWCRTGKSVATGLAQPEQLATLIAGMKLTVILPCQHISLHAPRLPTRSERHIRESLPYALEEDLACELDDSHFAFRKATDGVVLTAVIGQSALHYYLQRFQALGLRPDQLIPEAYICPAERPSLLVHDTYFVLLNGVEDIFCGQLDQLQACLALYSGTETPSVFDLRRTEHDPLVLSKIDASVADWVVRPGSAEALFAELVVDYSPALAVNLLQGSYAIQRDQGYGVYYRYAAVVALLVFMVSFVELWLENDTLQNRYQTLTAQTEQIYRTTFPQAQRVEDPRVQMQQQLQRIQTAAAARSTDFIGLLANTGEVLQRFGKGRVTRLLFREEQLRVELRVPTENMIQQIIAALQALHTVSVTVQPIRKKQKQYETTLFVQAVQDGTP